MISKDLEAENIKRAEKWISIVLRGGVLLSGGVIALGLILSWVKPNDNFTTKLPSLLAGQITESATPRSFFEFTCDVLSLDPGTIMTLGLLLLITLPIARVALTVGIFVKEKDYLFLAITTFVLCVLLFGLFFGKSL